MADFPPAVNIRPNTARNFTATLCMTRMGMRRRAVIDKSDSHLFRICNLKSPRAVDA